MRLCWARASRSRVRVVVVAVFGDAHAHAEALDAVIGAAEACGVQELWSLGDMTGRGPDPEHVVARTRERCAVALSKAGSRTLRWAAVEAAHHAWRPSNPWHPLYSDITARAGKHSAKSAVARKVLIAAWHVLSRQQSFKPAAPRRARPASASSRCFLAA